jgi:WD40 repeat protein
MIGTLDRNPHKNQILASSINPKAWDMNYLRVLFQLNLQEDIASDSGLIDVGENMLPVNSTFYKKLTGTSKRAYGSKEFFDVQYSPDYQNIATGSYSNKLHFWDAENIAKINTLTPSQKMIYAIDYSPDGNQMACGTFDNELIVYDLQANKEIARVSNDRNHVYTVK